MFFWLVFRNAKKLCAFACTCDQLTYSSLMGKSSMAFWSRSVLQVSSHFHCFFTVKILPHSSIPRLIFETLSYPDDLSVFGLIHQLSCLPYPSLSPVLFSAEIYCFSHVKFTLNELLSMEKWLVTMVILFKKSFFQWHLVAMLIA